MPRKKWEDNTRHVVRTRTPKWLPIVNVMATLLKERGTPASTRQVFDMWWDWEVEKRKTVMPGRANRIPTYAPSRTELGGWLARDKRFVNTNTGPRSSGKAANWIYTEVVG